MPDTLQTLADLISDRFDVTPEVASDLLNDAPLVRALSMIESSDGTHHKYSKKVSAPTVGFRTVNTGRNLSKSGKVLVDAELKLLDWTFEVDQAVAAANRKKTPEQHVEEEGLEHLAQAIFEYEAQLLNGQAGGDATGFTGFLDLPTLANSDSEMVVNATGTSANAATSVYAIRLGGEVGNNGIRGVYKGDGEPFDIGKTVTQKVTLADTTSYSAWYTPAFAWLGVEMGSKFSVGRICNLTTQTDKGLDDSLLSRLIAKFPAGRKPTHLVMNRQSQQQLQDSRTATNQTGAPAPFPESAFKLPIITTDAITSTEAIAVAA